MEPECIPSSSLPDTSRIFADYLTHFEKVQRYFARPPLAMDWWADELQRIRYPRERREAVADVLERQNREFGAGPKTLANIQRLRDGAPVIVTGQQVVLFGGPVFCLLKAITAVKLAEKAGAVPVFWLATEDHDVAEVNCVSLPDGDHLQTFSVRPVTSEGAPVGDIVFSDEITAAVKQVEANFGASDVTKLLAESYRPGETFGSAFARLYARLFSDLGIVLLDARDVALHRVAQPLYVESLRQWKTIHDLLMSRSEELERAGYHAQVKVTDAHTLCFYLPDGVRTPVRHRPGGFLVGTQELTEQELLDEAEKFPERFSANVLLRPVVQDYLLPTLCYVGGPAEVAYFAQAEVVYQKLLGRVTPVVPRIMATLVEARQAKLLDRYQLKLTDLFHEPAKVAEVLAAKTLPAGILKTFDDATAQMDGWLTQIQSELQKLDATLVDAAKTSGSKMHHQLQSLRDKAARAEIRKSGEIQHHADELVTLLYPRKTLQEREVGVLYFLLRYGTALLPRLQQQLRLGCPDHQVIRLQSEF